MHRGCAARNGRATPGPQATVATNVTHPGCHPLAAGLAELRMVTPEEGADDAENAGGTAPRDSVHSVKVLREGTCFAALLAREHQRQWLLATPSGQQEYEYIVLAVERRQDGKGWWLCVRSTLPPDMTARALARLFGPSLQRPSRSELAQYRGDSWSDARFTGLGKRAIHPVVAGVLSYETGAGRSVDQAVSLDDRALHEIGHAIGVVPAGAGAHDRTQIGIAMDKRRVWSTRRPSNRREPSRPDRETHRRDLRPVLRCQLGRRVSNRRHGGPPVRGCGAGSAHPSRRCGHQP
jgi:hypothetical protein